MKKSQLNEAIEVLEAKGWTVYKISSGLIAPGTKQSKLYKALASCRGVYPACQIDYITGAKLQHASQGRHFAVIYKPESE